MNNHPHQGPPNNNDCGCEENDTATQKAITTERKKYCDALYATAGEVSKSEASYDGLSTLHENRKCLFFWTESNYRRYRNTEMGMSTELQQTNELIKTNVSTYTSWSNDLSTSLKNIVKGIKDMKTKLSDFRDAASKLENCKNDSCNCSQVSLITGEVSENCKDSEKPDRDRPKECQDSAQILNDLICMPKALGFDADYLFKASSDVVGIQVFSNIQTLVPLQNAFSEDAKSFGKIIQDLTKKKEGDVKKAHDDLVKSVQETAKSVSALYNTRSDFEGLLCTTKFVCCPKCNCIVESEKCNEPRLKKCKDDICEICKEVQETFCNDGSNEPGKAS